MRDLAHGGSKFLGGGRDLGGGGGQFIGAGGLFRNRGLLLLGGGRDIGRRGSDLNAGILDLFYQVVEIVQHLFDATSELVDVLIPFDSNIAGQIPVGRGGGGGE